MIERSNDAPSYNDALAWLYGLKPHGIQLGLDRVKEALHRLVYLTTAREISEL